MKKFFLIPLFSLAFAMLLSACFKNNVERCTNNTLEQDKRVIDSFIAKSGQNSITWRSQGFYAGVSSPGSGDLAKEGSLVKYKRVLSLLDGTKVEEITLPLAGAASNVTLNQINLYPFEYFALTSIGEGGTIRLIMPSSMGFGCSGGINPQTGQLVIPPNAQLVYDYTLLEVKPQQ